MILFSGNEEKHFFVHKTAVNMKFLRKVQEHKGLAKHNVRDLDFMAAFVVPSPL